MFLRGRLAVNVAPAVVVVVVVADYKTLPLRGDGCSISDLFFAQFLHLDSSPSIPRSNV